MTADFFKFFPPNPNKHGVFYGLKPEGDKKLKTEDSKPVTPELLERHLNADPERFRLGYLPASSDTATSVGMIDLDTKNYEGKEPGAIDDDRLRLLDIAEAKGLSVYTETSTRRGLHLFVFLDAPILFRDMQKFLELLGNLAGIEGFETYPKGDDVKSVWYLMPYAGAAKDPNRLGATFLIDADGVPIPYDELSEWIKPSPVSAAYQVLLAHPKQAQEDRQATSETYTSEAFELLKQAVLNPPASFERHNSIVAFINLARRSGSEAAMLELLKSEDTYRAWIKDGSRYLKDWHDEIDRWVKCQTASTKRRGIPFLSKQGFKIPDLPKVKAEGDKPQIVVNAHVADTARDIVKHLLELEVNNQPAIYQRGEGLLVELRESNGGLKLYERSKPDSLKALLHEQLRPVTISVDSAKKETYKPSTFNTNHASSLLRDCERFPHIKSISDVPLVLPDGSILSKPGYYREHGYFLNTSGIEVNLMSVQDALEVFINAFDEFSYQSPKAGFAATVALILQPFLMPLIDDLTPLYAILGTLRAGSGTGKGYLIDCIYRIHTGKPYSHDGSMPATNEECAKVLFAALSEGTSHIIFDDVSEVKHRELMAAITSRFYKGRILGVSQRHEISTGVTWVITGNAPDIHRDFYRRMIPIQMGQGKFRAWEKQYSNPDLHRDILENRNLYISAALSIVKHWIDQGQPLSQKTIKGFDRWSAVMGGILESIGLPYLSDAREGLDQLIEVDNSDLDVLMDFWAKSELSKASIKGKNLLSLAKRANVFVEIWENKSDEVAAAALAKYLKPFANDVFGNFYFRREFHSDSKTYLYRLEAVVETPATLRDIFDFGTQRSRNNPRSTPVDTQDGTFTGDVRGSFTVFETTEGLEGDVIRI